MAVDVRLFGGEVVPEDVRLRTPATETLLAGVAAPLMVMAVVAVAGGLLPADTTPKLELRATSFVTSPTLGPNDVKIGVPPVAPGVTAVSSPLMALQPSAVITPTLPASVAARMPLLAAVFVLDRTSIRNDVWLRVPPDPDPADVRICHIPDTFSDSLTLTSSGFLTLAVNVDFLGNLLLGAVAATSMAANGDLVADLSHTATASLSSNAGLDAAVALTLPASTSFMSTGLLSLEGALTLPALAALQLSAALDASGNLLLPAVAALSLSTNWVTNASAQFTGTASLLCSFSLESNASITFTTSPLLSLTGSIESSAALILSAVAGFSSDRSLTHLSVAEFISNATLVLDVEQHRFQIPFEVAPPRPPLTVVAGPPPGVHLTRATRAPTVAVPPASPSFEPSVKDKPGQIRIKRDK